ncbi:hypothetical protein [Bradyrhizobium septentrionale]|uniref:HEPN AbiU2-like domain-containing protein n=1 Tax=Bradyrhizobium septentrionale TaxID=1404411 RepID=A0ABZ2P4Q6_9BRAD
MSRSTHKFARLDALASKGKLGSVLVRLMMVVNDMSLAMDGQRRWTEDAGKARAHRERGAKIYFVRLQISHIFEAVKILEEIRGDPDLMRAVDRSGSPMQKAFAALLAFKSTAEFKIMARIRNNLTFHYDPRTIELALASLVAKHPDATGSMSLGDEPHNWFFEAGDMVGDRAAVREIFKVPEGADVAAETDRIVMRLHQIVQMFGGFAGSLIWQNSR